MLSKFGKSRRFKDSGDLLRNCEPWENHLKEEAYSEINKALRKKKGIPSPKQKLTTHNISERFIFFGQGVTDQKIK